MTTQRKPAQKAVPVEVTPDVQALMSLPDELAKTRAEISRVADGIDRIGGGLVDISRFWKKWGPVLVGGSLAVFPNLAPIIGFIDRVLTSLPG